MSTERDSWGFSIFCDDFRQEVGGKYSLMGVYQADLIYSNDLPFYLPKFVIFIKYHELAGQFSDDLILNIFMPGDEEKKPTFAHTFARSDLVAAPISIPVEDDSERIFALTYPTIFAPFLINKEGFIAVRMQCGDITTKLGRLVIRKVRSTDQVQFV